MCVLEGREGTVACVRGVTRGVTLTDRGGTGRVVFRRCFLLKTSIENKTIAEREFAAAVAALHSSDPAIGRTDHINFMPVTARFHNAPRPQTTRSDKNAAQQFETTRLHREVARLQRELSAHEGPTLLSIQVENARLEREVHRLTQEVRRFRIAQRGRCCDAEVQCNLPITSLAVHWHEVEHEEPDAKSTAAVHAAVPEILKPPQPPIAKVDSRMETEWEAHGGLDFEAPIRSGAIAFLDSMWLMDHAENPGFRLRRRQDLPESAFISLNDLKAAGCSASNGLPLIVISCPWLTPTEPDPDGFFLKQVLFALKSFATNGRRFGVYWDFVSLFQPDASGKLAEKEDSLRDKALDYQALLYSSSSTLVFMCTRVPDQYVEAAGSNVKPYVERSGKTYVERGAKMLCTSAIPQQSRPSLRTWTLPAFVCNRLVHRGVDVVHFDQESGETAQSRQVEPERA